jgi:uncharacterized membrane protein
MSYYLVLKFLHVIGTAVLLGTGAGIAFFLLLANRTNKAAKTGRRLIGCALNAASIVAPAG